MRKPPKTSLVKYISERYTLEWESEHDAWVSRWKDDRGEWRIFVKQHGLVTVAHWRERGPTYREIFDYPNFKRSDQSTPHTDIYLALYKLVEQTNNGLPPTL